MNWFRKVPKWVLAVILFGVSGSFIFWGIPSVFNYAGVAPLVQVGDVKVYPQEFQSEFTRYLKERGEQERRNITTEEGRARGFDAIALQRLVSRLLVNQKAKELGLDFSREQVIDLLKTVPGLSDGHGNINPEVLGQVLQQNETNEAGLIAKIQGDMIKQQLMNTLLAKVELPKGMLVALQRFRTERRIVEYLMIDPSRAGEIKDPDEATLKKFYEEHIAEFSIPELRSVTIVTASVKEVAAGIEVKEEDIKAAYDANKARYVTPEKRKVEQIRFPTEEKARAAAQQIASGKSFEDVAKENGFKPEDVQLGEISADDKTVPPEAFTLPLNKASDPIKGTFGWVIVRATSSTPGSVKTLEQVHQELHDSLAADRAKEQVFKLSTDYDDARGGGATMEEAAKKLNLKLTKIPAIDKSGKSEAGQTVENLPVGGDFLGKIFAADAGVESGLQESEDGVYFEFRVDNVKPAAKKPFESVRNDVLTMWRNDQQHQKLQAIADGLIKRGTAGETMAQLGSGLGVAPLKTDPLPRYPATTVFSEAALRSVFDAKIGGFFTATVPDGKSILVGRVDSSIQQPDPPGSPAVGMYENLLAQAFEADIANQFTVALRHEICSRKTMWESVFGSRLQDCVDEAEFTRVHAGE